jgi:WD40 repeat protein
MGLAKTLGCVSGFVLAILWWFGATLVMAQQQAFRVYTLASGWGYHSAAFAPDDRYIAVIASKVSREEQALELTQEIQVWDFRDSNLISKKLLSRKKSSDVSDHEISLYGYARSGSMILLGRNDHLMLLDSRTLDEIREIQLATGNWPHVLPQSPTSSFVKGVAVDKSGDRAVVLLQWGRGVGGELRVYDLNSGNLLRTWDYRTLRKNDRNADFGGVDISADGRRVVVSIIPFVLGEGVLHSSDRNVFVLDIDSGSTIAAVNTNYPAGRIRFAPTTPPVLLTVSADNFDRRRSPKDAIKVWDPASGKFLRELANKDGGVHFQVQVSSDGHIVLGNTGAERFEGHWWLGQEENGFVGYDQFTLWDLDTGSIIVSSPQIKPAESHRNFLLSPSGDVVLVYPETAGGETLIFYEFRRTP